jgi:hypothetical protein
MRKILSVSKVLMLGCMAAILMSPQVFSEEGSTRALLESRYISESDVDAQSGQLTIAETRFSFEHEFKLDNGMPITVSFLDKHTEINSDVAVYLPSKLEGRSLGLGVKFPAPCTESENYFVGLDVFPSMYTDGWSETSSSAFRMPGRAYLIYKRDENFIVIAGLSIRPGFDTTVLPLIGFIYRPNDQWEFNFSSDNPNVKYQLSDKTKVLLEADIINDEYEVTHNGEKGRVLFYRELSTGIGLEHNFTDSITGLVSFGGVFSRMVKYEDDNGKIRPDAGMYVKARLSVHF